LSPPGWNGDHDAEEQVDVSEGENKRLHELQRILAKPYSDFLEQETGIVG
jgi:hypothetical protein